MKVGSLTILQRFQDKNQTRVLCKCDCGNELTRYLGNINRQDMLGKPVTCHDCRVKRHGHDVIGKTFGNRIVISDLYKDYCGRTNEHFAVCRCACGRIDTVRVCPLIKGRINECVDCREIKNRITNKKFKGWKKK